MKRHRSQEHNALMERMCDEFNEARSVKELALIAHLYIEYFVNELVIDRFRQPDLLIDDNDLGTFKSKVTILKALGTFDGTPHVLKNMGLVQRIRNFYAHSLLMADDVPDEVASRIRQLEYFEDGVICDFDEEWDRHVDELLSQLHICAIATTNGLVELLEEDGDAAEPGATDNPDDAQ